MQVTKKNYKEDFKVLIALPDQYNGENFIVNLWSGGAVYTAKYDGSTYTNCAMSDTKHVIVLADNHKLRCGLVEAEIIIFLPDASMPDGNMKLVTRKPVTITNEEITSVLVLHEGQSDSVPASSIVVEALANFIKGPKGDAYVLTETDKQYIASLIQTTYVVDATLTHSGAAADAKVVGDKISELKDAIRDLDGDELIVCDREGNVIARINKDGLHTTDVETKLDGFYEDSVYVCDKEGNVILSISADGVKTTKLVADNILLNQWEGKVIATYGDSVTALNGGDHYRPFVKSNYGWALDVAKYFNFNSLKNRGIGSTTFNWRNSDGGQICWVNSNTGEYVGRDDSYTYANYQGHVEIPAECTPIRGCGSSWLRITSMFKEEFKDDVDVVLVMYHNDFHQDMNTEVQWVANSETDPEWARSEFYNKYGGDYNIESVKGGIASVVMKLQAWMPNALIVLMTPISGVYVNGNENVKDLENAESAKMKKLAETVEDIAFRMSIPCIDVYGTDGINSLNHSQFITDGIHPNNNDGCLKIARAICSGLINMIPNLK